MFYYQTTEDEDVGNVYIRRKNKAEKYQSPEMLGASSLTTLAINRTPHLSRLDHQVTTAKWGRQESQPISSPLCEESQEATQIFIKTEARKMLPLNVKGQLCLTGN